MSHFTPQQLVQVRNKISMFSLIYDILGLNRQFNRIWRFCCPLCQQYNTAIKKETNLARCFDCQRNFNTIDMVIYVKQFEFKQSVEFLLPWIPQSTEQKESRAKAFDCVHNQKTGRQKALQEIAKIKQLLRTT
jgi:hypothetical protein